MGLGSEDAESFVATHARLITEIEQCVARYDAAATPEVVAVISSVASKKRTELVRGGNEVGFVAAHFAAAEWARGTVMLNEPEVVKSREFDRAIACRRITDAMKQGIRLMPSDAGDMPAMIEQEFNWASAVITEDKPPVQQRTVRTPPGQKRELLLGKAAAIRKDIESREIRDDYSDSVYQIVTKRGVSWDTWKRSDSFAEARIDAQRYQDTRGRQADVGKLPAEKATCESCSDQFRTWQCENCGQNIYDQCIGCHSSSCVSR